MSMAEPLCDARVSGFEDLRTMTKLLMFTALIVLCSSLFAADASSNQWRISVLASEISSGDANQPWSDDSKAGVGLGIAYAPAPQWDVELTVASQTHVSPYTRVFYVIGPSDEVGTLYPATEYRQYRVTPIDLSATRHFLVDGPIAPYVRAGVRYVGAPADPAPTTSVIVPTEYPYNPAFLPVSEGFNFGDRVSAQ